MFRPTLLALVLSALSLAPAGAESSPGSAIAFPFPAIVIPFPPPLPPLPPTWPIPFPLPDRDEEPSQHIDRNEFSSPLLPHETFETPSELARALTLKKVLDLLRAADDKRAALERIEARLARQSFDFSFEIGLLYGGLADDQLEASIRYLEVQIGARRLLPVPGGGYNPYGIEPRPFPSYDLPVVPLAPSFPFGAGFRLNFDFF